MTEYTWHKSSRHYDLVTDAWRHIFGEHFHLGYFKSKDESLEDATQALVERLASLVEMDGQSEVLDVGCGIGTPAFALHEKHGCSVVGISPSQRGIELATKSAQERGVEGKVRFRLAYGENNGFPDDHFDVVWLMESSHTMKDKVKLFEECRRALKPSGSLVLCDIMLRKRPTWVTHLSTLARLRTDYPLGFLKLKRSMGSGKTESIEYYARVLGKVGFNKVETMDISDRAFPTLDHWRANIAEKRDQLLSAFTEKKLNDFVASCNLLEDLYRHGIMGYGMVRARR